MTEWREVATGVFQARYNPLDISICLVRGTAGLLLVDTRCNPREGAELQADVQALGLGEIRWVVNTHAHYDHTFGNQAFAETALILGHARIAEHFARFEAPRLAAWAVDPAAQPQYDWAGVTLTAPRASVDDALRVDLGDRVVELIALPPGHTDTDVVVHVPDAGVWIVGDVIEQSGPPMYGSGSFPLGWPDALRELAARIGPADVVIPGHGRPVDRAFVVEQTRMLEVVAEAIRSGHGRAEPIEYVAERAADAAGIPLPFAEAAVLRGFQQLTGS